MEYTRSQRRTMANLLWAGFYKCPNNGDVLAALHGDDKVLCRCRKPNPAVPSEYPGCHLTRYLRVATTDEWIDFEEARRKVYHEE